MCVLCVCTKCTNIHGNMCVYMDEYIVYVHIYITRLIDYVCECVYVYILYMHT